VSVRNHLEKNLAWAKGSGGGLDHPLVLGVGVIRIPVGMGVLKTWYRQNWPISNSYERG